MLEAMLEQALDDARTPDGLRPIDACYVGSNAATRLAAWARNHSIHSCLIVADANTRQASGDTVHRALCDAAIQATPYDFGSAPIDATDALGDAVARKGDACAAYVAVGSGSLCDLAKYAGNLQNKPVILFATAASMNGYTSGIVALKINGLKRTSPCKPASAVFADPAIIAAAPRRMSAAGVGDYLSKCASAADWQAAHFFRGEYFHPQALKLYEGVIEKVLDAAPRVGQGDPEATALVLEALLLSGLSMLMAGSSSPASGGEHLVSHYLDMHAAIHDAPHDLHGAQVGVATIDCLRLWDAVLYSSLDNWNIDALLDAQPSPDQVQDWAVLDWGSAVASEVMLQWGKKVLPNDAMYRELQRFHDQRDTLRDLVRNDLLPPHIVADAIAAAGGHITPESLDAPVHCYHNALRRARFIRDRFTILDLAAETGLQP